jgi:hypothetical protein
MGRVGIGAAMHSVTVMVGAAATDGAAATADMADMAAERSFMAAIAVQRWVADVVVVGADAVVAAAAAKANINLACFRRAIVPLGRLDNAIELECVTFEMGQNRTFDDIRVMSPLPPTATE